MLGDEVVKALRKQVTILPFHAEWIRAAYHPDIQVAGVIMPTRFSQDVVIRVSGCPGYHSR